MQMLEETCLAACRRSYEGRRAPVPAGQLGPREWDGLQDALNWLKITSCSLRNNVLSIDSVNSEARKHLAAVERFENAFAASGMQLFPEARDRIGFFHLFVNYWRDAAAECAALGLGGDISCAYYGEHIELPEKVILARKWFETAVKLTNADQVNHHHIEKFITAGRDHIHAMAECRSSWPLARRLSIDRLYSTCGLHVTQWLYMSAVTAREIARIRGSDAATIEAISQNEKKARERLVKVRKIFRQGKQDRRAFRAFMLKKRTCAHCGKTGPLSQKSFAYCGGCRHSRVAREHWARYCSEACQSAHWAAGHKDECPCARDE
jgi:hypothetical protein